MSMRRADFAQLLIRATKCFFEIMGIRPAGCPLATAASSTVAILSRTNGRSCREPFEGVLDFPCEFSPRLNTFRPRHESFGSIGKGTSLFLREQRQALAHGMRHSSR